MQLPNEFTALLPLWIISIAAILLLLLEAFAGKSGRLLSPWLAGMAIIIALISEFWSFANPSGYLFDGTVFIDHFTVLIQMAGLISALLAIFFAAPYLIKERAVTGEFYALLLFSVAGILTVAVAAEFLTLFVGIELMSIPGYVLAGYFRVRERSAEAAMKYFIQGVFSSAFLLFGIAILYGSSGTTFFSGIAFAVKDQSTLLPSLGAVMLLAGIGFKVAMVPFHGWAPDVYDGAASPITTFLATGLKAAGFAALTRVFLQIFNFHGVWNDAFIVLATITMLLGNFTSLAQTNVKRMLAYSSITHAGYILTGFAVIDQVNSSEMMHAVGFYVLTYTLMAGGAFGFISWVGESRTNFADFKGIGLRYPVIAMPMAIFMFSLAGFPPTAGFFAKYYVFKLAINHGFVWLGVISVLNSFLSIYYYLRVVMYMYMMPTEETTSSILEKPAPSVIIGLVLAAAGILTIAYVNISL